MKKIIISTLFMVFLFATTTFAHTNLKTSNPTDGQIIDSSLSEITLQFDTGIEDTSLLTITDEAGEEIPVSTSVNNDILTAKVESPLKDGTYQVTWNIIGEDGHPMSGSYLFMVNASEASEAAAQADSEEKSSINWVMIILGVVVFVLVLSVLTKPNNRRRRRY